MNVPRAWPTLADRYRAVLGAVGAVLFVAAAAMLAPLLALPFYPTETVYWPSFAGPAGLAVAAGAYLVAGPGRGTRHRLQVEDSAVVVVLGWLVTFAACAAPFWLGRQAGLLGAFYESVSGWTTTGLSVLAVEATPQVFLLYRSLMQWVGGLGFAVLMASAVLGPWAYGLYQAEGRSELLLPHIMRTSKLILGIYGGLTVAGTLAYTATGIGFFHALNHTMCALSTGGFSTRAASLGAFNSPAAEVITIALMVIGTTNFGVIFLLMRRRYKEAWRHGEVRLFAGGLLIVATLLRLLAGGGGRSVAFQAVSALSTSGFATVDFAAWSDGAMLIMTLAMIVGGQVNATAGGLKQYRVYLALKSVAWGIRRLWRPRAAVTPLIIHQMGQKRAVSADETLANNGFVLLYLVTYAVGVAVLAGLGYSLRDAAFEFASSLSTVGLSTGITGAHSPPALLAVQMAGMILGRLEFLVVFAGLAKLGRALPRLTTRRGRAAHPPRVNSPGPGNTLP